MLFDIESGLRAAASRDVSSVKFPFLRLLAAVDESEQTGAIEGWKPFLRRGDSIANATIDARAAAVSPADPGALFFSSGSTGKLKGILSAHRGICLQLWRWRSWYAIEEPIRSWSANGFFWSGNFAIALGSTLSSGGAIILQRTFDPQEALWLMEQERASFLFAWPHQWAQLVAAPNWGDVDLSSLKYIDASSPIGKHPTVSTTWHEPTSAYGNTETFTISAIFPANTPEEVRAGNHGMPAAGNTFKVVDPLTGIALARGERGEVAVKGPTLMLGYLGIPLDETLDDEGFFRTGDGGYFDQEGRLYWEGRLNDIIKTGGANVSPVEIDEVIRTCPGVKLVQTVGVPDDLLGEMVVTCIIRHEGAVLSEAAVQAFTKEMLASYKVPRRVLFFSEADLQTTGTAKVKTAELRSLAAGALDLDRQIGT